MALTNADYRDIYRGKTPPKGYVLTEVLSAMFIVAAVLAVALACFYRLAL